MNDRKDKTKQLSIPMDLEPREIKEYAKQHWNITFARQKTVSVYAKRIMAIVMAQIRDGDGDLLPYYQMHITDVVTDDIDINSAYSRVKKAFEELTDLKWLIEDIDRKRFQIRHLINTSDARCGYRDGFITVCLNPLLKPFFIEIAHYTTYELKYYMTFGSWYSMRMFELLSAYKDTGKWVVSIDEFRELLDCKEKYPLIKDLLKRTLTEPLKELESSKMAFDYETIHEVRKGRGKRKVISLIFTLKKVEIKKIPVEWFEFSDDQKKVLNRLLHHYKVTEANITKYAQSIGYKKTVQLLQEWDKKERSERKIDDKVKYCNAVWVRLGKSLVID